MSMKLILEKIQYWLVNHPTINNFEWKNGITPYTSLQFLILTLFSYLFITFFFMLFHHYHYFKPLPKPLLRLISAVHNLIILLLSFIIAVGCTLSTLSQAPHPHWIFCFPANQTPPRGPTFFWAYIFYLAKILELFDTLLILLSGNIRRISFVHVYHHLTVPMLFYIWVDTSQSMLPVVVVTNATVHTVVYWYYLTCTLEIRSSWKRFVTGCQIIQFVFCFLLSGLMVYYHFNKFECSGFIWGWCLGIVYSVSLLCLFLDFYTNNYTKKEFMKYQ